MNNDISKLEIDGLYSKLESKELLSVGERVLYYFIQENYLTPVYIKGVLYLRKNEVIELKKTRTAFWHKHLTYKEVLEYGVPKELASKYLEVNLPFFAKGDGLRCAYSKEKTLKLAEFEEKLRNEEYISVTAARKLMGITHPPLFEKILKEFNIKKITYSTVLEIDNIQKISYIRQEDIVNLMNEKTEVEKDVMLISVAAEKYGVESKQIRRNKSIIKIAKEDKRAIILGTEKTLVSFENVKSELDKKKDPLYKNTLGSAIRNNPLNDIFGETDYLTVIKRIEFLEAESKIVNIKSKSFAFWKKHLEGALDGNSFKSTQSGESLRQKYVNATFKIDELLQVANVDEIYHLNYKTLNVWLKNLKNDKIQSILYSFLMYLANSLEIKKNKSIKFNKDFISAQFINPNSQQYKESESLKITKEEDLYSYETYIKVYEHLIKRDFHVNVFFEEREMNNNKEYIYLSAWLYELLHLNLAWRNGDVLHFPRINLTSLLDEFGIDNIDWFKNNALTESQSRKVITKITNYYFKIRKTNVYGIFVCSDKLKSSVATAILMLEIHWLNEMGVKVTENLNQIFLLDFKTRYNEPTKTMLKAPVKGVRNFVFQSRKMNRSVLTFLYNTAQELNSSGYNALLLPKYLRAHMNEMSTVQYIKFTEKQLQFLSEELFLRGEFGYLTDKLLDIVAAGKSGKSRERTFEIACVNKWFGGGEKIEALTGMLNYFSVERNDVIKELELAIQDEECIHEEMNVKYGFDKTRNLLSAIYMGGLVAKDERIQCIFSEQDCKSPDLKCLDCKYSIPNVYMLNELCEALQKEIVEYFGTKKIGKKLKMSAKIHRKIIVLMEAIDTFGSEYVYGFLDISREEFIELFDTIINVKSLIESVNGGSLRC